MHTSLNNRGFTIVELLIVVVVIAILAAITIVSYNGITNRANASAAASAAATVQKKAELFATDGTTGKYPAAFTDLTSASPSTTYYLTGIINGTPAATNGKNTIQYRVCGHGASTTVAPATVTAMTTGSGSITGGIINYWNYSSSGTLPLTVGQTTGATPTTNYLVGCVTV